jgi:hypothetical protein
MWVTASSCQKLVVKKASDASYNGIDSVGNLFNAQNLKSVIQQAGANAEESDLNDDFVGKAKK